MCFIYLLEANPEYVAFTDALQLASCLEADVDAFITNDKSLLRVEKPRVLLISDLAAPD